jgi:hypothetical protein
MYVKIEVMKNHLILLTIMNGTHGSIAAKILAEIARVT